MIWIKNNKKGNSLIEIIVSVGIFVVVMLIATGIFETVAKSQQLAIASQNTQENLRYSFEIMSKEIRSAKRSDYACSAFGNFRVFNSIASSSWSATGNIFYFKDKNDNCVYYFKSGNALMVHRKTPGNEYTASTTPNEIIVDSFDVHVYDNDITGFPTYKKQPYVTISVKAHAVGHSQLDSSIILQTTVSSRMYE
jgi:hypothetical protein